MKSGGPEGSPPEHYICICVRQGLDIYRLLRVRSFAANGGSINGELAGGMVMSLLTLRDGIVVAVLSNIAHANTSALGLQIGEAFATQAR